MKKDIPTLSIIIPVFNKVELTQHKGWIHIDEDDDVSKVCFECNCSIPEPTYKIPFKDYEIKTAYDFVHSKENDVEDYISENDLFEKGIKEDDKLVIER